MQRDYYEDLGIDKSSSERDIAQAYRKLSLQWHPKIQGSEDQQTRYSFFCKVSEAYEVLSDPGKRSFYDKYGEEKLKEGFFSQATLKGGYRFGGNPEDIFEKFFGTSDPFQQIYGSATQESLGGLFGYTFQTQSGQELPLPPKQLHVPVECTLLELFNGAQKHVTYGRTILNKDGRTTKHIKEMKEIVILPGQKDGEQIKYNLLGNEVAGLPNSDLIFTLKELKHPTLVRKGADLIYSHKISLIDSLQGKPVHITTLDGRKLLIPIDAIINPKYVKKVEGEGMPIYNEAEYKNVDQFGQKPQKGDLFIHFNIQFPSQIDEDKQQELEDLLRQLK